MLTAMIHSTNTNTYTNTTNDNNTFTNTNTDTNIYTNTNTKDNTNAKIQLICAYSYSE